MPHSKTSKLAFLSVSSVALFYCLQYLTSVLPSMTVNQLMNHFHTGAEAIGFLNSVYFYTFFIFLFISGPIIDRFPAKWIATIACAVCAITTYTTTISSNISAAYMSRAFMGASSAFAYPLMLYLIKELFSNRWFTFFASIYSSTAGVFILIFNLFIAAYLMNTPLQKPHISLAIVGVVFTGMCLLFARNSKKHNARVSRESDWEFLKKIPLLFKNKRYLLLLLITLLLFAPFALFSASWGMEFLKANQGFSERRAAVIIAFLYGGNTVGTIVFGMLADWLKYRKWQIIICALLGAIILFVTIYVPTLSFSGTATLYFLLAFLSGVSINVYYYAKTICDNDITASGIAVVTAISNVGYMVLPPLLGVILDNSWHGAMAQGARIYARGAYQTGFIITPICFILVAILAFFLHE